MESLRTDAAETDLVSRSVPLSTPSFRAVLRDADAPRTVWSAPEEATVVGSGAAATLIADGSSRFSSIREATESLFASGDVHAGTEAARPRLFGGFAFHADSTSGPPWEDFPGARFVFPRVQVTWTDDDAWVTVNAVGRDVDPDTVDEARRLAAAAERVVVKAGTNSLTDESSNLDEGKVDKLVEDVVDFRRQGRDVLLVSSGAVGAGIGLLDATDETSETVEAAETSETVETADTVEESQALSTVGQSQLMRRYSESFERFGVTVAQILLTEHDLEDPERFTNFQNTIEQLLAWDIVPIINENDAVATEELRIGVNDMLSSSVAIGVDPGNPKHDRSAERIEAVGSNYAAVQELVDESSTTGFGGIETKVAGARAASEHGIPAVIAESTEADVLAKIGDAKQVGTLFVPTNGGDDD